MGIKSEFLFNILGSLALFGILSLNLSCSSDDPDVEPEVIVEEPGGEPEAVEGAELPQISVNTNSGTIVDEPKVNAILSIIENGSETYNGAIGIEFRGASSQSFPKKSYGVETRDENNEDLDASLLGFPEEEDWILYGPFSDKSLMRNMLIYELSRDLDRYASRSKFVELSINGASQGVYVFMEKLKRNEGRIDISDLTEDENSGDDLTGGYILKIDKTAGDNLGEGYNSRNSFASQYSPLNAATGQRINYLYEEPDAKVITEEQKSYISDYVGQFEEALASEDFANADTGYSAYIDAESFIDFFLLNELANNVDGYRLSTYMNKDKNGKLKMGPIWDFNLAFGNADYCSGGETNVWAYRFNERCPQDFWLVPFWWERLLQDPGYVALLKQRWNELRGGTFSEAEIFAKIDTYISTLENSGAVTDNFQTWPVLGTYVWPNNFVGDTYSDEIGYLKKWITDRLAWLDAEIEEL